MSAINFSPPIGHINACSLYNKADDAVDITNNKIVSKNLI
jgi:hypothetical protein